MGDKSNMLPSLERDKSLNRGWVESVFSCKHAASKAINPGSVLSPNLSHQFLTKLGRVRGLTLALPSLLAAIFYIINSSPEKQMLRIATARVVAAMKDTLAFRNSSITNSPSYSVGGSCDTTDGDDTMPKPAPAHRPIPAASGFPDTLPEPIYSFLSHICNFGGRV